MWSNAYLSVYDINNMPYSSATATVCTYLQLCDVSHIVQAAHSKVLTWTHSQASWMGNDPLLMTCCWSLNEVIKRMQPSRSSGEAGSMCTIAGFCIRGGL